MPFVSEIESVTLMAELQPETAEREIKRAVGARHKIARRYLMRLRKRSPEASPAEIIATLERHYVTAITIAGGVVTAGTIAADVGLALIPGVAAGKEAGKASCAVKQRLSSMLRNARRAGVTGSDTCFRGRIRNHPALLCGVLAPSPGTRAVDAVPSHASERAARCAPAGERSRPGGRDRPTP